MLSVRATSVSNKFKWKRILVPSTLTHQTIKERDSSLSHQLGDLLKRLLDFHRPGRHDQINLNQLERLRQLELHPELAYETLKSGMSHSLLKLRELGPLEVKQQVNMALSLLGHVPPYNGRGLRILAIDGGGTRGLIPIITLQYLERMSGLKVCEMFDYVSGTSTGALLATLVFIEKVSVEEAELLYKKLSAKIFKMNNLLGIGQLFLNQSFYDSSLLEKQVRKFEASAKKMYETSCDPSVPKISFVSTLINQPVVQPFLFTNYRHQPNNKSHYISLCDTFLWKAIMASTAAPGYFEEVKIGPYILQDGGLLTNNPAAVALHEARRLWGHKVPIQCLVSLGTGQYTTCYIKKSGGRSTSLREKLIQIVASATDTEAVHTILQDILPSNCYYRFNPTLTEAIALDNCDPKQLQTVINDTKKYIESNTELLKDAAKTLVETKTLKQKLLGGHGKQWPR